MFEIYYPLTQTDGKYQFNCMRKFISNTYYVQGSHFYIMKTIKDWIAWYFKQHEFHIWKFSIFNICI